MKFGILYNFWLYMSIWGTFWPLKAKKWGKMGQKRCAWSGLQHIWLILMKSVQNEKYCFLKWLRCAKKNFHLSKEKNIFWLFLWFWKNHKNDQKSLFSFERWKFFWHTLIILETVFFHFLYFLIRSKKIKKVTFFTFFLATNCPSFNFEGQKVHKI